jgi:hypothetical protein
MLTIEYAKNPKYNSQNKREILLTVKFAEFTEELPFTATDFDSEEHGRILHANALKGDYGTIAPFSS